jgi:hypothetical protein
VRDRRDILICLKSGAWMLVSHIARKISTNNREVVKKVCDDYVEQGFAESKAAKEIGFERSVGFAYHITPDGLEKAEKIQKIMEDPDTKNFF